MHALVFGCPACGRRMGVGLALAGRRVRCPHCQAVAVAPAAPLTDSATLLASFPTPLRPAGRDARQAAESIFQDKSDDADDADSILSAAGDDSSNRVPAPTEFAPAPAALAPPRPAADLGDMVPTEPAGAAAAFGPPRPGAVDLFRPAPDAPPVDHAAVTNPWTKLVPPGFDDVAVGPPAADPVAGPTRDRLVVGLAVYATLVTLVAAWGWLGR